MSETKCYSRGCKNPPAWVVMPRWGKPTSFVMCDCCRPRVENRPAHLRHLPFAYDVQPIKP